VNTETAELASEATMAPAAAAVSRAAADSAARIALYNYLSQELTASRAANQAILIHSAAAAAAALSAVTAAAAALFTLTTAAAAAAATALAAALAALATATAQPA
jgi:hypothetical protein